MDANHYLKLIEKEQEAFSKVLVKYLPKIKKENYRVLDFCSGAANEEPLLLKYFGQNTELISIDNDKSLENLLKELGRKTAIIGDIRNLGKYVSGKFDLIMGRNVPLNPPYNSSNDFWPKFFQELPKFMKKDSALFLTLLRDDEYYRAEALLKKSLYLIIKSEKNEIVVPTDEIGVRGIDTKDHYVIIAKKPAQSMLDQYF